MGFFSSRRFSRKCRILISREAMAGFLLQRGWRPSERAHRKYTIRQTGEPSRPLSLFRLSEVQTK